ncbi:(Acyl-carrier-protein) S-malonyltransferase [Desulfobulbus propionicus DSM 2032]|jgi:[acyl-carrier-protein] S-malonyltransferase|uniref:Malonyl CoA-acyl carrier protein transacylase n=1 Tax=Desulfobulbus propionicus (strain ATCC 33891 / DSM 2032 / VKM B-1956 / 1pr3) TaxID=577650 RepID=A0A7U3YNL0_DESPD|nr:ACP S-malonyltransferase [Desulfobulbus propionicus]ADW18533.1 (Acyl-carrier-protein) S-malonyltransferase [Desulfobulbus propionicus DSM 2032]
MKKTAIIFPGQGSQFIGMGQEFVNRDQDASVLMDLAETISAFPLRKLCFEGPLEDLTRVLYLQPALTVINLICWQQLLKLLPGFKPAFFAGHSLGEYSALHGAGVLTLEDTLALVTKRGELMEREGAAHPGGMRAVVGLAINDVEALLERFTGPGVAVVANHNTASQIVLSGDAPGLEAIGQLCAAQGAKVIPLKVSVANHSPLVAGAVEDFAAYMNSIEFQHPQVPVLFNVTGDYEQNPSAMRNIMARQIASRVRWLSIIERMVAEGVEVVVELGPKNVLTGMMKKILPKDTPITCLQADSPEGLHKVAEVLAG